MVYERFRSIGVARWIRGSRLVQGPTRRLTTEASARAQTSIRLWPLECTVPLHNYVERNVTSLRKQRPRTRQGHVALAKRRPRFVERHALKLIRRVTRSLLGRIEVGPISSRTRKSADFQPLDVTLVSVGHF